MDKITFLAAAKDYFKVRGYVVVTLGADEIEMRSVSGDRCNVFVWEDHEVRVSSRAWVSDLAELAGVFGGIGVKAGSSTVAGYAYFRI